MYCLPSWANCHESDYNIPWANPTLVITSHAGAFDIWHDSSIWMPAACYHPLIKIKSRFGGWKSRHDHPLVKTKTSIWRVEAFLGLLMLISSGRPLVFRSWWKPDFERPYPYPPKSWNFKGVVLKFLRINCQTGKWKFGQTKRISVSYSICVLLYICTVYCTCPILLPTS